MKNTSEPTEPPDAAFKNFDRLFRAVVTVPKSEVEKEEAKERLRNRKLRDKRKASKKRAKA